LSWNVFGEHLRILTFGESHGPALGVVIDGLPPEEKIDPGAIQEELDRRKPGHRTMGSARKEPDRVEILSGIFEGKTTGHPMAMIIRNKNAKPGDYEALKDLFRPGHADLTWKLKYGIRDYRGGGRSSGRETVARVAAGAVAKQLLRAKGVEILAWTEAIAPHKAKAFVPAYILKNSLFCCDPAAFATMLKAVEEAKKAGDSIGGQVSVLIQGAPSGLGDPVFGKLDAQLAHAMMSIGAVKGVEIGDGFDLAECLGSQSNDPIGEKRQLLTNRCGGILGGVSTGGPIKIRLGVKPTPSISKNQNTCDIHGQKHTISVKGRHDPCICPRLAPVAEAMAALVILDGIQRQKILKGEPVDKDSLRARIDLLDRTLLQITKDRIETVRSLFALKKEAGQEREDLQREEDILKLRKKWALELGLDEEMASQIIRVIIDQGKRFLKD